jgi:hypothetical protein
VQVHEREQTEVEDYYPDEIESFTQDLIVLLESLENWVFGKQIQQKNYKYVLVLYRDQR